MNSNKIYLIITTLVFLLTATSCEDFLTQNPQSKIPAEDIFSSRENTNAYMMGMFKEWRDCHKKWHEYALGTDEYKLGGVQYRDNERKRGVELYNGELTATNTNTLEYWKTRYQLISKATLAIDKLQSVKGVDLLMSRYLAEAYALRGACYFELVQYFGPIPLNNSEVIAEHGSRRQPLELVYAKIEEDLLNAIEFLPEHSSAEYQDNKRRFSKAFAHAMLGKTYLYALEESGFRNYEKAAEQFKIVYDDPALGKTNPTPYNIIFDETGKSEDEFAADYEREMVYAFRYSNVRDDNNEFAWNFGSRAVSIMTDVEAMIYYAGFDNIMPTRYCYSMRDDGGLWEKNDLRRELSIRYNFTYNGNEPLLLGWCWGDELDPHIKKYEDMRIIEKKLNTWYSGKHVPYLRFSDIVLCYAECLYFTGHQAQGIDLINDVVRKRAFTSRPVKWPTNMDEEEFMDNLMDERMRELCFEGWRRMDLIRTGTAEKYVPARNYWFLEKGINTIDKTRLRFPIPLDEISMNPDMTADDQNEGYN